MQHGFYNELDELRQDDPEADFGFLENVEIGETRNAFPYLHGFCADFAAALSDAYGYSIETVRQYSEDEFAGRLIHAYCVTEIQGEKAYIDIRGITTNAELFFEEFENQVTYFPEDGELWDLDGPAVVDLWSSKKTLFDGDYEDWLDEELSSFIRSYSDYYDKTVVIVKKPSLTDQIKAASGRAAASDSNYTQSQTLTPERN